jgi:muramoyltetrapeptide carboxypeptidase
MSHIYIYSPCGAVNDRPAFRRGVRRLQQMGHEVEIDPDALARVQRFAGDDETRLAAIARAASSRADVALITRGGYGLTRLLPRLPYRQLARAVERGMQLVGLSDFTALQLALLAQTGAASWAGPALLETFGAAVPDPVTLACFDDLAGGVSQGAGWRLPAAGRGAARPLPDELRIGPALLWGGNLSVLVSLLGTPWFPQVKGGILFLEDVGEHPYRIERMLTQLLHAGVLARQKAILLGHFSGYRLTPHDRGFDLPAVIARLGEQVKAPILRGLPFGHVPTKVLLPVGMKVTLLAQEREALLFWG